MFFLGETKVQLYSHCLLRAFCIRNLRRSCGVILGWRRHIRISTYFHWMTSMSVCVRVKKKKKREKNSVLLYNSVNLTLASSSYLRKKRLDVWCCSGIGAVKNRSEKRTSSGRLQRARGFLSLTRPITGPLKAGQARKTAGHNTEGNFNTIICDNMLFSVCLLEHMQIFSR